MTRIISQFKSSGQPRRSAAKILSRALGFFLGLHSLEKGSNILGRHDFSLFSESAQKVIQRRLHVVVSGQQFPLLKPGDGKQK